MSFAWIDWILLAVIGFGLWRGARSGFFQQAASIVGLVGGFLLAAHLMPAGGATLRQWWGLDPRVAPLVAFILVFLVAVLVVLIGARFFDYLVGVLHVGLLDSALGGLLGALQTVLLLSVLFWFSAQFDWPSDQTRRRSVLVTPIEAFAGEAWEWTRRVWPRIDEFYDQLGKRADRRTAVRFSEIGAGEGLSVSSISVDEDAVGDDLAGDDGPAAAVSQSFVVPEVVE